jgi:transcriptional regulator
VYVPKHFSETRMDVLQAFTERHAFATLVAVTREGLTANHLPLTSRLSPDGTGVLRGHIARANSLWREVENGAAVLAIFDGAHSYVSPSWYPSKREHGKVVPTWNYATVHVSGKIRFIEDAGWLRQFVTSLTDVQEEGRADRWHVSDAPSDYIEAMLRAIVGLEIDVTRVVGKFKGSQNRSDADRAGVAAALRAEGRSPEEIAEIAPGAEPGAEPRAD